MSYSDARDLFRARVAANAPQLTTSNTSVLMAFADAFLTQDAATNAAMNNSASNIVYPTAAGAALVTKAQDYGVSPSAGMVANGNVVFSLATPQATTTTIPVGFIVGTNADGITASAPQFQTTAVATIAAYSGGSAVLANYATGPVPVSCTQPGTFGNVAAGTIVATSLGSGAGGAGGGTGLQVSNATSVVTNGGTVSNPSGACTGGVNADNDQALRTKIASVVYTPYSIANVQAQMVATGAYDSLAVDNGDGTLTYYWAAADGTAPTITGGTVGTPAPPTVSGGVLTGSYVLTGTAALVDTAVRNAVPIGVTIKIGAAGTVSGNVLTQTFQVLSVTNVPIVYSAPAAQQPQTIEPLIQSAVVAYLQTLTHGQSVLVSRLYDYVQGQVGGVLTGFNIGTTYTSIGATTPATSAVTSTQLVRCPGAPSSVVTCTRV